MTGSVDTRSNPFVGEARARRAGVLLVEDLDVVRVGLAALVGSSSELAVAGERTSVAAAIDGLDGDPPAVAVVAVALDGGRGIEVAAALRDRWPSTAVVLLGGAPSPERLERAGAAGAVAYVLTSVAADELVPVLERIARGEAPRAFLVGHPPAVVDWADDRWREARLTRQETRVLALITDSLTNRQIARRMELGEATVKNYVRSVLAKLGFERRTQAVIYGVHLRARGWSAAAGERAGPAPLPSTPSEAGEAT
ncbi:MAG TPA: response regulator transcription factor [Acidimicrobiales bacterium]|nr:response regulator transcription factor [Acidimicrobiales bacterium]